MVGHCDKYSNVIPSHNSPSSVWTYGAGNTWYPGTNDWE
jgi:hypothetical protein